MIQLMWFRNDLRIHDNPALAEAMKSGTVVAIYLLAEGQWDNHCVSEAKRSLIVRQLHTLAEQLNNLNIPFFVKQCEFFDESSKVLIDFALDLKAESVFFNQEYELNESVRDKQVSKHFMIHGKKVFSYHDSCMIPPGQVLNKSNQPYKVFTPFKQAFLYEYYDQGRPLSPVPSPQRSLPMSSSIELLSEIKLNNTWDKYWPCGENEAHERLDRFVETSLSRYHKDRDFPALPGTSTLSPYLSIGAISTTQCMRTIMSRSDSKVESICKGTSDWMGELIWREFYRHLLVFNHQLCMHKPFKPETDNLPWKHNTKVFEAWCEGRTGFPIVDAAMRQLKTTGWMHNRLRMIVSMFLTKNLFIDWRWGEQYFMANLVDGDFASNNGGWQWSASTGVDAAPYFRIFNPIRQSQKFDPDGKFIKAFLPELRSLDSKDIHEPTSFQIRALNYPEPIVHLADSAKRAKHLFRSLNNHNESSFLDEVDISA